MALDPVPFTIYYQKPGIKPPVYLVGTFTEPAWKPEEMETDFDSNGELVFSKQIWVDSPQDSHHYKFRIGRDDRWALDQNSPVVVDEFGAQCNLLQASDLVSHQDQSQSSVQTSATERSLTHPRFHMPLHNGGNDIHGIGIVAADPDSRSAVTYSVDEVTADDTEDEEDECDDLHTPLFAHECLGAYDFGSSEVKETTNDVNPRSRDTRRSWMDYSFEDIDINDPTIESFPSDRSSVMDALRTIQTSKGENPVPLKDIPLSPGTAVGFGSVQPGHLGGVNTPEESSSWSSRRRDGQRASLGAFGREKSVLSLGSIAEETKEEEEDVEEEEEEVEEEDISDHALLSAGSSDFEEALQIKERDKAKSMEKSGLEVKHVKYGGRPLAA